MRGQPEDFGHLWCAAAIQSIDEPKREAFEFHIRQEFAEQLGVRRETVWRYTQKPAFAAALTRHQSEQRGTVQLELEADVREAIQLLRGLMQDHTSPANTRVRAAIVLMDRAGLTPAYATEARQRSEASALAAQQREEPAPEVVARRVLTALPMVVSVLGVAEAQAGLAIGAWVGFGVRWVPLEVVCVLCLE